MHVIARVLGRNGYTAEESGEFSFPDLGSTQWKVLTNGTKYILCKDDGRYVKFVEYVPRDSIVFYMEREWKRRPKDDGEYNLGGDPTNFHGKRMPTNFGQELKKYGKTPIPGAS